MGEVADMMLEGQMCQGCGEVLGDGDGYPVLCDGCQQEQGVDQHGEKKTPKPNRQKTRCPECDKKVKVTGLAMHRRDVHGE